MEKIPDEETRIGGASSFPGEEGRNINDCRGWRYRLFPKDGSARLIAPEKGNLVKLLCKTCGFLDDSLYEVVGFGLNSENLGINPAVMDYGLNIVSRTISLINHGPKYCGSPPPNWSIVARVSI